MFIIGFSWVRNTELQVLYENQSPFFRQLYFLYKIDFVYDIIKSTITGKGFN